MTELSIALTGWSANNPTPGNFVEVSFAQGQASGASLTYGILLMGNMTSAGSATADTVLYGPDTPIPLVTLTDAANLFGLGSELYRMFKRAIEINQDTPIYAVVVTASNTTAATGLITYTTNAAAAGTGRVHCGDDFVDFSINSGDDVTAIAAAAVVAINTKTDWPVTATSALGVVTLLARIKGVRGNLLRIGAQVFGTGLATTVAPGPMAFMGTASGGVAGAGVDTWTTALATVAARRFYYVVPADDGSQSATGLTALVAQIGTQALPMNGIRQTVGVGANNPTASSVVTLAIGANGNNARVDYFHQLAGDVPPSELAAHCIAGIALYQATLDGAHVNLNSFGDTEKTRALWRLKPPKSGVAFTPTQITTALNNGISPIQSANGRSFLVAHITSKSLTSAVNDYRIRPAHKRSICDRFADDVQAKAALQCSGRTIANNPVSGAVKPPPNAITPDIFKKTVIFPVIDAYATRGLVDPDRVDTIKAGTTCVRSTVPTTRLIAYVPLEPIDILDATGVLLAQVA